MDSALIFYRSIYEIIFSIFAFLVFVFIDTVQIRSYRVMIRSNAVRNYKNVFDDKGEPE